MRDDSRRSPHPGDADGLTAADRRLDLQIGRTARRLRDEGAPPPRDLWPDIAAGIDQVERRRLPRRRSAGLRRAAALAACLLLLLGFGLVERVGEGPAGPAAESAPPAADSGSPWAAGREAVEVAFADLNAAFDVAPEDANISRLIMLLHRSRSRLLREEIHQETGAAARPGL